MNCIEAREWLPRMSYGDLAPEQAAQVEKHLASCPACSAEYMTVQRLRRSLDALPAPTVQVDLSRLYQQATEQQLRRLRRWRRVAVGLLAAAATFLIALAFNGMPGETAHQTRMREVLTALYEELDFTTPATRDRPPQSP